MDDGTLEPKSRWLEDPEFNDCMDLKSFQVRFPGLRNGGRFRNAFLVFDRPSFMGISIAARATQQSTLTVEVVNKRGVRKASVKLEWAFTFEPPSPPSMKRPDDA